MKIHEINDFNDLTNIGELWDRTLSKSQANNVFMTFAWISTWWKYFGDKRTLLVLLVEKEGKIIAIAPLMHSREGWPSTSGRIRFIGTGYTQYQDFILTEDKKKALEIIFDYLGRHRLKWNQMDLREIPEDSNSIKLLREIAKERGYIFVEKLQSVCPYLTLHQPWKENYKKLSAKFRRDLRRSLRRLQEKHEVHFKFVKEADDLNDGMQSFFHLFLKRRIKKDPRRRYSFSRKRVQDFFLDVAKNFFYRGWLSLSFLIIDGRPASSILAFLYRKKLWSYNVGWDPIYSKYGLGHLHLMYLIKHCVDSGLEEFDFLKGAEHYKKKWAASSRNAVSVVILKRDLKGIVYIASLKISKYRAIRKGISKFRTIMRRLRRKN